MTSPGVKLGSAVSLVALLLAYYYRPPPEAEMRAQLGEVLSGLLRAEEKVAHTPRARVAVGFGSCRDVFADGVRLMDALAGNDDDVTPRHTDELHTAQETLDMFAYFFRHGAAAERFITNVTLFDDMVRVAEGLPGARSDLGGNAPVMAHRFHQEGCRVLLGAHMSDELRTHIGAGVEVTGSGEDSDDVHLVLEYDRGSHFREYTSPRANRFIVHSDRSNPRLSSLEGFRRQVASFSPDLLVIGGLQMMDSYPFTGGERRERLRLLAELLATTPTQQKIHFEMASFAEEECLRDVIDHVVGYADSLGMNEQELPNLYSVLTNGSVTLVSDPHPRIATTLDHMRAVYRLLRAARPGRRPLTRLHVHTLAYQAILTTRGSDWRNTMSAAAKASLVANRHTCGSPEISPDKARILVDDSFSTSRADGGERVPFQPERPVSCWEEDDFRVCIAPVLVCTEVVQTAGGGDNISSAGLVLQI